VYNDITLYIRVLFHLNVNVMLVTKVSSLTGISHTMDLNVTQEQLNRYEIGLGLIQDIFPQLSCEDREFIKTGITPEEWEKIFGVMEVD